MRAPTRTCRAGSLHRTAPHLQNFRPGLAVERRENWGTAIAGLGGRVEEPQSLHLRADLARRNGSSSSDSAGDSRLQPITYIAD